MGKSLKGKELGKNISQRKNGTYMARFVNRFGQRQTIYSQTLNELRSRLREEQYKDEKEINVVTKHITLDEWFDTWLNTCKRNCRNTTKRTYTIQYNRLRGELGWRNLSDLSLIVVQKAFNHLKTDASRRDCKAILVDMLNRAMESDLIIKNVALSVNTKIDNDEKEEKRILSSDEVELLLEASRKGRLYPLIVIALNTGMRMGEIIGLTWNCVDFDNGMIYVTKTLCYLSNNGDAIYEFHPPKSKAGKRKIPMSKKAREILLEQKQWHVNVEKRFRAAPGFEDLVFTSKTNYPINESNVRSAIRYLVERMNREYPNLNFEPFTPHSLRHTFATNCIEKGMRPKTLQKILGHNSLQMTMDLYCHVHDETLIQEMASVVEMV